MIGHSSRSIHPVRLPVVLLLVLSSSMPGLAEERTYAEAGCVLGEGEPGVVVDVTDGGTLQLEDGRLVRLAAIGPMSDPDAMRALAVRTRGQPVWLHQGAPVADRYGRVVAHVFAGDGGWIQAELVESGGAVVSGSAGARDCLAELLAHERVARSAGLGLWQRDDAVLTAWSDALRTGGDRYVLVEGLVVSVGRTRNTVYLNFGRDWSIDLTVTIDNDHISIVEAEGGALESLEGQQVRIRGWVRERDGPWIEVDHAEQIELVGGG